MCDISELIETLHGDHSLTLVIANHGEIRLFTERGVEGIRRTYLSDPDFLKGASIADKVVGKAAAAFMIEGEAGEVYADIMGEGAIDLFQKSGIKFSYGATTPTILNRSRNGRCPLDTVSADLICPKDIIENINKFFNK